MALPLLLFPVADVYYYPYYRIAFFLAITTVKTIITYPSLNVMTAQLYLAVLFYLQFYGISNK
jgi:hypothetical protein